MISPFIRGDFGKSALGSDYFRLGPCNVYFGNQTPTTLTGTGTRNTTNLKQLDGTGTFFTSELSVGDYIVFSTTYTGAPFRVTKIIDNDTLEVNADLPAITNSPIYKLNLIYLGGVDAVSLKWKLNKVDLKASQYGDTAADRAVTGYEVSVEMGLTSPTLERLNATIQGFDLQYNSTTGEIEGGAFTLRMGELDSDIAGELHLIRIVGGNDSIDPLDHIVVYKAVPMVDAEVKYDAASQLSIKQTFNAYVDRTRLFNNSPVIFSVGNVTLTTP